MGTHEELHKLCRLRSTLEAFALRCWRHGDGRERRGAELRGRLAVLKRCASRGDYLAFHAADQEFHRRAVAAAGMAPLMKSWEMVAAELSEWILNVKQSYWPNLMALYREHELLLDAWLSSDDWLAEQATHQHLEAGWYRRTLAEGASGADLDPVQRAVSFIATHFTSPLDIAWLASHVSFVSASQLNRLFRSRMKTSPLRYLKQVRLERAAQVLCSGSDAVGTVARRVGYRSTSHFVRDFKKAFGITPLHYRQRRRT